MQMRHTYVIAIMDIFLSFMGYKNLQDTCFMLLHDPLINLNSAISSISYGFEFNTKVDHYLFPDGT